MNRTAELQTTIDRLASELEQAKKDLEALKKPAMPWVPEDGDIYYYIVADGTVRQASYFIVGETPEGRKHFGNCFRIREEAESWAKVLRVFNKLRQLGATGGM